MAQDKNEFQDVVCALEAGHIMAAATLREIPGSKTYDVTKLSVGRASRALLARTRPRILILHSAAGAMAVCKLHPETGHASLKWAKKIPDIRQVYHINKKVQGLEGTQLTIEFFPKNGAVFKDVLLFKEQEAASFCGEVAAFKVGGMTRAISLDASNPALAGIEPGVHLRNMDSSVTANPLAVASMFPDKQQYTETAPASPASSPSPNPQPQGKRESFAPAPVPVLAKPSAPAFPAAQQAPVPVLAKPSAPAFPAAQQVQKEPPKHQIGDLLSGALPPQGPTSRDIEGKVQPTSGADVSMSKAQDPERQLADEFGFLFKESATSAAPVSFENAPSVDLNRSTDGSPFFKETHNTSIASATNPFDQGFATAFAPPTAYHIAQPPRNQNDQLFMAQPAPPKDSWSLQDPFQELSQTTWNR